MAEECSTSESPLWLSFAAIAGTKEALQVIIIMLMGVDHHNFLIWQNGMICKPTVISEAI